MTSISKERIAEIKALVETGGPETPWRAAARDLLAALEAAMEWRPISEAPKDGRRLLLVARDMYGDRDPGGAHIRMDTAWWDGHRWLGGHFTTHYPPSHWMPLPAPPSTEGER